LQCYRYSSRCYEAAALVALQLALLQHCDALALQLTLLRRYNSRYCGAIHGCNAALRHYGVALGCNAALRVALLLLFFFF
jgi:hypothetical protein